MSSKDEQSKLYKKLLGQLGQNPQLQGIGRSSAMEAMLRQQQAMQDRDFAMQRAVQDRDYAMQKATLDRDYAMQKAVQKLGGLGNPFREKRKLNIVQLLLGVRRYRTPKAFHTATMMASMASYL